MKSINLLPPVIYNRLAAGEVVENPASIVKELVENSLDAGAKKITIQIANGGIDEIIVIDDGEGVDANNITKVLLPHATSKIKEVADIDHITSLGFRGEAMASIAAVAKMEFTSRPANQTYAVMVNERNEQKQIAANCGTTVQVTDLFYNTPARKKFLRSSNTEKNNVTKVIHDFIFAHPDLVWRYAVDGKMIIDYQAAGLTTAVTQIFAIDAAALLPVESQGNGLRLQGLISDTHHTRPTRDRQVVIINGRVVNGGIIAAAVNETMANYLMVKEYPSFVLSLTVATEQIDVNVHPQKREVRFENKGQIIQFVRSAITKTMDQYFLNQLKTLPSVTTPTEQPTVPPAATQSNITGHSFNPEQITTQNILVQSLDVLNQSQNSDLVESAPNILNQIYLNSAAASVEQVNALPQTVYQVLGQVFETYLLVQTPDALLIIDQHAMAERVNYDNFRRQIDAGTVQSQIMLVPAMIKVTPTEMIKFEKMRPTLSSFGFDCDQFGEDTIRVTAIPAIMSSTTVNEFLSVFLNDKEITDTTLSEALCHKVATMACKASIRAGDVLTNAQIEAFVNQYLQTKNLPLCPHGRPIMLVYSRSNLESLFARK